MATNLEQLFKRDIFESFKVVSGKNYLNKNITGVSILETPDFEKYIIDGTLILTTFYIINKNIELFSNLIKTLSKYNSPGIIIKLYRYIDEIPQTIIELSNECEIPIVILEYDANLSVIYNSIYAEIQSNDYLQFNFHAKFVEYMSLIDDNPSTSALLEGTDDIKDLKLFFYNCETQKERYSDSIMKTFFDTYKNSKLDYIRIEDGILYKRDVWFNQNKIYMFMLYAPISKRHIINTYSEIYNILITLIYQKKREKILKQDRFLVDFISNFSSFNRTNQDMINEGKLYNWHISFPVVMILFILKEDISKAVQQGNNLPLKIREIIKNYTRCNEDEIKYIFFDDKILFIKNCMNSSLDENIDSICEDIYDNVTNGAIFLTSYTSEIDDSKDLPSYYRNLIEVSTFVSNINKCTIIRPSQIDFIKIIKELNSKELNALLTNLIFPLTEYERKYEIPLCETLLTYYQCHFNCKEAANRLFIHYNSLKYRLSLIEKLGFPISNLEYDYSPLLLALYLYSLKVI